MACNQFHTLSSSIHSSPPFPNSRRGIILNQRPWRPRPHPSISSQISTPSNSQTDEDNDSKNNKLNLLKLSVTLTVVSTSFPMYSAVAATASKEAKERRRGAKKSSAKKVEALSPQELVSWSQGLPSVSNRIPYTEILDLKREGKVKHVIKVANGFFRLRSEPVMVVLEDSRVLRTVLPSVENNPRFWELWDELGIDSVCVNAYTPPIKPPDVPTPYLGFLARVPAFMYSFVKPKKESKRAAEIRRVREELKMEKTFELAKMRQEREMIEKAMKMQKKEEERRIKRETRKKKQEESLREARKNYQHMAIVWANLARDSNVATALGLVFFVIFYRTVVFSYRRQKKDYEDRLKIEKAEAEERKKMGELEREMEGIEGEDDDIEQGKGEQNPYLKMAMQFMKSGARVRRAHGKRLPQYLERGVNVKFEDVAGLGKIRLELEEIVKFFTQGEMYRRRGVKIPG